MKRKMRNRHGVPRTLQLDYSGPNRHFIRNWLRKVIPRTLNFVPRRFLYFWREPRFRMHWCRFETRVSVWSILHFGNLMSVHLVPLRVNMFHLTNQPTSPPMNPKPGWSRARLQLLRWVVTWGAGKKREVKMTDDESYSRWWSQRFAGFLRIEKKVRNFNDLLFLSREM